MMMHEIESKANQALEKCNKLQEDLTALNNNLSSQINAVQKNVDALADSFGSPSDYLKTNSVLTKSNMPQEVLSQLVTGQTAQLFASTGEILLTKTKTTDFITVAYISERLNRPLIKDTEYSLTQVNNDVRIDLNPTLIASDANIYVQIMKVGAH